MYVSSSLVLYIFVGVKASKRPIICMCLWYAQLRNFTYTRTLISSQYMQMKFATTTCSKSSFEDWQYSFFAACRSINKQPCACTVTRALEVGLLHPYRDAYNQTFWTVVVKWFLNFETTAGDSALENVILI